MLARFCLYGFLKNQKYYEPFLILIFLDKGLSYFAIGLLIAFRQVWVNIFEVPSGFIADTFGRRRSMIYSFAAYILSFFVFALSASLLMLFVGMFLFAIGEAFRTGTHKAMIFDWLLSQGRREERTKVYGYTRSWSQIGSAVSVIIAAVAVIITKNYSSIFYFATIPYALAILNFLSYPKSLDGRFDKNKKGSALFTVFIEVLKNIFRKKSLRGLFLESAIFKGNATLTKDYLQPILKQAVLALPILHIMEAESRTSIFIGITYALLYLLSSLASRKSHRFVKISGSYVNASRNLWLMNIILFSAAAVGIQFGDVLIAVPFLVAAIVIQNIWRPILMSRIDHVSEADSGATVLSIDSQASSLYVLVFAPLLGAGVDAFGLGVVGLLGVLGSVLCLVNVNRMEGSRHR